MSNLHFIPFVLFTLYTLFFIPIKLAFLLAEGNLYVYDIHVLFMLTNADVKQLDIDIKNRYSLQENKVNDK